ncbi:MAG TPA: peptide deformylase [Micromonosporaceae bacterium]|jgi:peptide deformylase|nr:peptide deformylase [Micromonosporaceae bacterium]
MAGSDVPAQRAAEAFAAELARWRVERGLTKKQLAVEMGFDPSYVSHVEGRRHRPTEDFARRAEAVLAASGAIWLRFKEYEEVRRAGRLTAGPGGRDPPVPEQWLPPGTGLVVEQELSDLSYVDGSYRCTVRRALYNASTEPVSRYLVRISVDRFPGEPERSNRHHREHPLRWDELDLQALCMSGADSTDPVGWESMEWRAKHDRDAFKEVWLLFENGNGRFPLYPGQRTTIEYGYTVGADKWGMWFQRAVRLPTRQLTVRLSFPAALSPAVWGLETSLSAEEVPLRTPIAARTVDDRAVFEWTTDSPALNARYRLQWRFRTPMLAGAEGAVIRPPVAPIKASERMRAAGIAQRGTDLLRQRAQPFDLPRDEPVARDVVQRLIATLDRVGEMHFFGKGVGLAAPQIGLGWAAAIVLPPELDDDPLVLLNPRIIGVGSDSDEQYEGCLSFFDHRGLVRRPLGIEVEHATLTGTRLITSYDQAIARLIAHEIDHLEGRLYVDRMAPGVPLVPVEEYRDTGRPWTY